MEDRFRLDDALRQGGLEAPCGRLGCFMCGANRIAELRLGRALAGGETSAATAEPTLARAETVVPGPRACTPETREDAILWLLAAIWGRFGDAAYARLVPAPDASRAGFVLARMRAHDARVAAERQARAEREAARSAAKAERRQRHAMRHGLKRKDWPE